MNEKNCGRPPLVNEVTIDIAGKSIQEVRACAIHLIENTTSRLEYEYTKPPKEMFYSWVFANGLR